jgi:hypothetical protein
VRLPPAVEELLQRRLPRPRKRERSSAGRSAEHQRIDELADEWATAVRNAATQFRLIAIEDKRNPPPRTRRPAAQATAAPLMGRGAGARPARSRSRRGAGPLPDGLPAAPGLAGGALTADSRRRRVLLERRAVDAPAKIERWGRAQHERIGGATRQRIAAAINAATQLRLRLALGDREPRPCVGRRPRKRPDLRWGPTPAIPARVPLTSQRPL